MKENLITKPVAEGRIFHNHYLMPFLQVLGASFFLALCSQIKIPLYFTPVPLTLQTLAVMMIGGVLGRKKGSLSVLLYLGQIAVGLPFCAGGASNPLALAGPTGGYFFGFVVQAYLTGEYLEKERPFDSAKLLLMIFLISLLPLAMGTVWLGYCLGWKDAMVFGFYPFIPGDIVKCIAAAVFLSKWCEMAHEKNSNLC
ncbi:MAG: biotin transporter BioY [Waddliaceae bacterium]